MPPAERVQPHRDRELGNGIRLVTPMATAQPMAAPVIPYLGMSSRSRPTFTTTAAIPLARLQLLRPVVISTMST